MKKFIKDHWDKLIILAVTVILFFIIFLPFILFNLLDKFDTPGLLSLSWFIKEYTFPDFQGWNPYFAAGFPQGILYPPLFHYVVAILGFVMPLASAYKLIITLAGLSIPAAVYYSNGRLYDQKGFRLLSTLLTLIILILVPGYLGFNFDGLLDYGLGPSFVSIPLFFWFLGVLFKDKPSTIKLSIIFSILTLTHLLTAAVAGMVVGSAFILKAIRSLNYKKLFPLIKFGVIVLGLIAFWIIPFIYFKQYSASGFAMSVSGMFPGFIILGIIGITVILVLTKSIKNVKIWSLFLPAFVIAVLGLLDAILNRNQSRFSIPLIHPFRTQMYGIILVTTTLTIALQKIHPLNIRLATKIGIMKFIKRNMHLTMNLIMVSIVLFAIGFIRLEPKGVEEVVVPNDLEWSGRVVRTYKVSEVLDQSRAVIDKSIIMNPDNFAVDGLLKESSYLAPYYQSLEKSMNPDNYDWDSLDQYYVENQKIPQEQLASLSDLMWVKNVYTIDQEFPNTQNCKNISEFTTQSLNDGLTERTIYLCEYVPTTESTFITPLQESPTVISESWNEALNNWWTSDTKKLFSDQEILIDQASQQAISAQAIDYKFINDYQSLEISSIAGQEIQALVKMSYFPKWEAVNEEGDDVEIKRISPDFMVIPLNNTLELEYKRTWIEWGTLLISIASWLWIVILLIIDRVRTWRKNQI